MKKLNILKIFAVLAVQIVILPSAVAADSFNLGDQALTRCSDWTLKLSFEQATEEYMQLSAEQNPDFGCISRASWMATEDLFRLENASKYTTRLKNFENKYKENSKMNLVTKKSLEDIQILFQLRWLTDNYEEMKTYKSAKVVTGVTSTTAALLAMGGAALLLKTPALNNLRETARPALIRMIKYLGAVIFARSAVVTTKAESVYGKVNPLQTKPPLDVISISSETFWNYSDLHLLRDIAAATADAVATGATHATVTIIGLRYFGVAVTAAGRFFSATSLIGLAVAYPIGKLAGFVTDRAITNQYHKIHSDETVRMVQTFKQNNLNDWQLNIMSAQLTNSAITWVSTQDLYLQAKIENELVNFSEWQICTRLRQRAFADLIQNRQKAHGISSGQPNLIVEGAARMNPIFSEAEIALKQKIYFEIEDKRARLLEVRTGILQRMMALEQLNKPYLRGYISQHHALIDRMDRYLNHDEIIQDNLNILRQLRENLAVDSEKWNDANYIKELGEQHHCI